MPEVSLWLTEAQDMFTFCFETERLWLLCSFFFTKFCDNPKSYVKKAIVILSRKPA